MDTKQILAKRKAQPQRSWCFTSFMTHASGGPKMPEDAKKDTFRMAVWQAEIAPDTKREHWQGYVLMKTPTRWRVVRNALGMLEDDHFEVARDKYASIAYCSKDATRAPGHSPVWYRREGDEAPKQGHRTDLEAAAKLAAEGRLKEIKGPEFVKYHAGLTKYMALHYKPTRKAPPEVRVYTGPSHSGKSHVAAKWLAAAVGIEDPDDVTKLSFDGGSKGSRFVAEPMERVEHALIDEFDPVIMPIDWLIPLLDGRPTRVGMKGGHTWFEPRFIAITTCKPVEAWYPETTRMDELLRRITRITRFKTPYPSKTKLPLLFDYNSSTEMNDVPVGRYQLPVPTGFLDTAPGAVDVATAEAKVTMSAAFGDRPPTSIKVRAICAVDGKIAEATVHGVAHALKASKRGCVPRANAGCKPTEDPYVPDTDIDWDAIARVSDDALDADIDAAMAELGL